MAGRQAWGTALQTAATAVLARFAERQPGAMLGVSLKAHLTRETLARSQNLLRHTEKPRPDTQPTRPTSTG